MRKATIHRKTNETEIALTLDIDGGGAYQIDTGIGFLDHMLAHMAVHGLFDLQLKARGDLHIDAHHTVEDCGLVLGQGFDEALGDRRGIWRIGSAYVPMDEALGFVAVDLSGRPFAVIDAVWHGPAVGGIATSLYEHFFASFAAAARCNVHARVLTGRDDHHQAEALAKAFGRAMDAATQIDPRRGKDIPSTKGSLV